MNSEYLYEILEHLPIYFKTEEDAQYFKKLIDGFTINFDNQNYGLSALSLHILFMTFYYKILWLIRIFENERFECAMIGFGSRTLEDFNKFEKNVLNRDIKKEKWTSDEEKIEELSKKLPFAFSKFNERSVFDLIKIVQDSPDLIKKSKEMVDLRNDLAHANGKIHFYNESSFLEHLESYRELMYGYFEINVPILTSCFQHYLLNFDFDLVDEYSIIDPDDEDTIKMYKLSFEEHFRENLIRKNYLSNMDLKFLMSFNIDDLKSDKNYEKIRIVFEFFKDFYD